MTIRYDDKNSLIDYANKLDMLSLEQKMQIGLMATFNGLMTPPLIIRMTLWLFRKKRNKLFVLFLKKAIENPDSHMPVWSDTIDHMVNGEDQFDPKSAGGWCKDELESFIEMADAIST